MPPDIEPLIHDIHEVAERLLVLVRREGRRMTAEERQRFGVCIRMIARHSGRNLADVIASVSRQSSARL